MTGKHELVRNKKIQFKKFFASIAIKIKKFMKFFSRKFVYKWRRLA